MTRPESAGYSASRRFGTLYSFGSLGGVIKEITKDPAKRIPQRRVGEMRNLDGSLLLLASDTRDCMTGSTAKVDRGRVVGSIGVAADIPTAALQRIA
jgi:hypothetical protein